jgi:hypothetical protein
VGDEVLSDRSDDSFGVGAHVILDIEVNRIASAYSKPFPRELKFHTWIDQIRETGLIGAQAADFVRGPWDCLRNPSQEQAMEDCSDYDRDS